MLLSRSVIGNTMGFGPVILGSSPSETAKVGVAKLANAADNSIPGVWRE